jgi:hypothetical protein
MLPTLTAITQANVVGHVEDKRQEIAHVRHLARLGDCGVAWLELSIHVDRHADVHGEKLEENLFARIPGFELETVSIPSVALVGRADVAVLIGVEIVVAMGHADRIPRPIVEVGRRARGCVRRRRVGGIGRVFFLEEPLRIKREFAPRRRRCRRRAAHRSRLGRGTPAPAVERHACSAERHVLQKIPTIGASPVSSHCFDS